MKNGCLRSESLTEESPSLTSTVAEGLSNPRGDDSSIAMESEEGSGAKSGQEFSKEEVRGILEAIASTGKYWHDWDKLQKLLSFQLKQVLSEYPEANMATEQQTASLGETHHELEKRLDEALLSFDEGPPFTLQRLCEILLDAQGVYPKLSKLALALEKNLLVTSTLPVSTEPHTEAVVQSPVEADKASRSPEVPSDSVENGLEPTLGEKDETMAEVEEGNMDEDNMAIDMETLEDIVGPKETNSMKTGNS